jgi:DNA-binding transcriptional MerR regulator
MKIGELAKRVNVSTRLLRYYEEQGLLVPKRAANGYRIYSEQLVGRVMQIRGLLDAGIPTRIIQNILPCLNALTELHFADATPEMIATLEQERDSLDRRIQCLTRNRDAISAYLEALRTLTMRENSTGESDDPHEISEQAGGMTSPTCLPRGESYDGLAST